MSANPLRPVLGSLGLSQIRHISAVRRGRAPELVRKVYQQIERDFGVLAPPVALHGPAPQVLAAVWVLLRETLVVQGRAPRGIKEAVATAVSVANACPYCATIHNQALMTLGRKGNAQSASVSELSELADWLQWAQVGGGPLPPPFPHDQLAEVVGVAVLLHYLNRVVNVLLRDVPLPPGVPEFALAPVLRVLGWMMRRASRRPHPAGLSLELLAPAALPADLSWAAQDRVIGEAFARACTVIDAAGERAVPAAVRELVLAQVVTWRGGLRGISRRWVDDLVAGLSSGQQAAGRLALLVAFASYQVDDGVVEGCRRAGLNDRELVELCSWAAMIASRRIGELLAGPRVG